MFHYSFCFAMAMLLLVNSVHAQDRASNDVNQAGTDLWWMRCPVGQKWDGSTCKGDAKGMNWQEAMKVCPSGYRLPTRKEFVRIFSGCSGDVKRNKKGECKSCESSEVCSSMFACYRFPYTGHGVAYRFWTTTNFPGRSQPSVWVVHMNYCKGKKVDFSQFGDTPKKLQSKALCVRKGK